MIRHVIHIADLHIPNQTAQFDEKCRNLHKAIINAAKELGQDTLRIVIVGDLFEGKVKASNEARKSFHKFLNIINQICPTLVVAGNHDMLENNHDKLDSLAPTFEIDGVYPNVKYLDKEVDYKSGYFVDDNVTWALYSMHDSFARPDLTEAACLYPSNTVVGLYHGDVPGATTDSGRMSESGLSGDAFLGCDCVMAGHIHKRQELRKDGIPIVYSGSVFQQAVDENTSGHGFEIWDLETMEHRHVEVENPYLMYKFRADSYDDVKNDVEKLLNL